MLGYNTWHPLCARKTNINFITLTFNIILVSTTVTVQYSTTILTSTTEGRFRMIHDHSIRNQYQYQYQYDSFPMTMWMGSTTSSSRPPPHTAGCGTCIKPHTPYVTEDENSNYRYYKYIIVETIQFGQYHQFFTGLGRIWIQIVILVLPLWGIQRWVCVVRCCCSESEGEGSTCLRDDAAHVESSAFDGSFPTNNNSSNKTVMKGSFKTAGANVIVIVNGIEIIILIEMLWIIFTIEQ